MRIGDKSTGNKRSFKVRNDPAGNSLKFDELKETLKLLEMEEHQEVIWKTLAAILILGDVRFAEGSNGEAEVQNTELANRGKFFFFYIQTLNFKFETCNLKVEIVKSLLVDIPFFAKFPL